MNLALVLLLLLIGLSGSIYNEGIDWKLIWLKTVFRNNLKVIFTVIFTVLVLFVSPDLL